MEAVLKPLYQRAAEAEERLSRLETAVSSNKVIGIGTHLGAGNEDLLKTISELQAKLEEEKAEREKASKEIQKLSVENAKLQYRITHLVRSLKEADCRLEVK